MNNLLIESAELGLLPVIKKLIEQGANVSVRDNYALRLAASWGHLEVVKYLVSQGAQDDLAIRWAVRYGHLETVKYLESLGGNGLKLN